MKPLAVDHAWNVTVDEAQAIQSRLASRVVRSDKLDRQVKTVAGVDVAYDKQSEQVYAAIAVIDCETMETIETQTAFSETRFPYIPGLFGFRELPSVLQAFNVLRQWPDLVICDGQGIAHPRRFGLASHLGVLLDIPTVGCGKSRHIGEYTDPGFERGSTSQLHDNGEVIGCALRTQSGVNPLFVSVGHRVSLETASGWVLRLATSFRQTEPIRRANELANQTRTALSDPRHLCE